MLKLLLPAMAMAALAGGHTAAAQSSRIGDVEIENPWARASVPSAPNGAAYVTLTSRGSEPDRLQSLTTPIAKRVEIHGHRMQDGLMKMERYADLEVAPGASIVFEPGGLHLMLLGLAQPLAQGDTFALTFQFERAGSVTLDVPVQALSTMSYMGPAHGSMNSKHDGDSKHHGDAHSKHGSMKHN
ncbi:MAG: copper chaperone PCu(A)C [Gammaproteobacteria bacterium]